MIKDETADDNITKASAIGKQFHSKSYRLGVLNRRKPELEFSSQEIKDIINRTRFKNKETPEEQKWFKERVKEFHEFEKRVPKLNSYEKSKIREQIKRRKVLRLWNEEKEKQKQQEDQKVTYNDIKALDNLFHNREKYGKETAIIEFSDSQGEGEDVDDELDDEIDDLEIANYEITLKKPEANWLASITPQHYWAEKYSRNILVDA
eukprot:CAMPEP_0197014318 /NCGR_PEP_ID=MMETSP1380-20130617/69804_1 /TAXON_ID=5936 /ORGANISM="Euplotes crassus, Strain CT5" /LENGTH=205 /DNA_ID=CAMNT_0042439245 /DNA_START=250 /DNA_END=865 /DNA_ORIENTATION=-